MIEFAMMRDHTIYKIETKRMITKVLLTKEKTNYNPLVFRVGRHNIAEKEGNSSQMPEKQPGLT